MPESQGIGDNFLMLLGNFTGKKGVGWFVNFGGHTVRCAPAVRKVGSFGPIFRMARVTAVTTVFPYAGLLRFLLSPQTQTVS